MTDDVAEFRRALFAHRNAVIARDVANGLTLEEIAAKHCLKPGSVAKLCQRHGIARPIRQSAVEKRTRLVHTPGPAHM